ncbi:hypothetical protein DSECCO2_369880 [anaerobic digester metagenome]
MGNRSVLDAQNQIRSLLGQFQFVQRHDDRDAPLLCQGPQNAQKFQLIADIQKGGGLVQYDDPGFLADRPGQQDSLALAIADPGKVPLGQGQGIHQLHGPEDSGPVCRGEDAQATGIGIAAGGDNLPAGHKFRFEPIGPDHRYLPGQVEAGHFGDGPPIDAHRSAQAFQLTGEAFQDRGLARAVGSDQGQNLPPLQGQADVPDQRDSVVADGETVRFEKISHVSHVLSFPAVC